MTKLYFLYILFCVYKTRTLVCSMETCDFFVTEGLLRKWREATDMHTESVTSVIEAPTNSGYVHSNIFFSSTLSEFVKVIRRLHESLLTEPMTIDDLHSKIEQPFLDWTLMQQMNKFYNLKRPQYLSDEGLQALNAQWNKIANLYEMRMAIHSVYDKIQQIRSINRDICTWKQKSESLQLSTNEMGVEYRKYTEEYKDGGIATKILSGHMHALLSALSTHSN